MGNVRTNNEDNLYCAGVTLTPETRLLPFSMTGETAAPCAFAVCDGMGGQEDGEFASLTAVSALTELDAAVKGATPDTIDSIVQEYVTKVNGAICNKMIEKSVRIGTTLALIIITPESIKPYNIGDSRIYNLTGGKLSQISEDHTLTAQKVSMGVLSAEQAKRDRDRHRLTRYLGIFEDEMVIEAEPLETLPTNENRRLLICSDGLTDMLPDYRIEKLLNGAAISDAANLLVGEALAAGGKDNTTCIVIDIDVDKKTDVNANVSADMQADVNANVSANIQADVNAIERANVNANLYANTNLASPEPMQVKKQSAPVRIFMMVVRLFKNIPSHIRKLIRRVAPNRGKK